MTAGVNKAILIGNLGKDPELKYSQNGKAIVRFSLATTGGWSGGEDKTEWHNIVMFDRLAEVANEYLRKGRTVYIEGRIQTRSWEDQSGNKRYTTEIVAAQMQMLGGPRSDDGAPKSQSRPEAKKQDVLPAEDAQTFSSQEPPLPTDDDLPF